MNSNQLVRFDWAIKKILRDKANFGILEGFLTVVLNQQIKILEIIESASNQETQDDKFNVVDLLVKNEKEELIIIEVQNSKQYDYFQRMLYGASKAICEHLSLGDKYLKVKKVYSITVAYFDLGQGEDYVYYGNTEFRGLYRKDKLMLAARQISLFEKNHIHELYPEYWIIKADKFDDKVSNKLDEWIYFLKHSEIPKEFSAPGLQEAREKLSEMRMSDDERKAYQFFKKRLSDLASLRFTNEVDFVDALNESEEKGRKKGTRKGRKEGRKKGRKEGRKKGRKEGRKEAMREALNKLVASGISLEAAKKILVL